MPCDYSKYHPEWKSKIRPTVMLRAKGCCEICGIQNYAIVRWNKELHRYEKMCGNAYYDQMLYTVSYAEAREACDYINEELDEKWIVIVLTISHVDHDITNNNMDNLQALCQRCHLKHDKEYHKANRKLTSQKNKGLQNLF